MLALGNHDLCGRNDNPSPATTKRGKDQHLPLSLLSSQQDYGLGAKAFEQVEA